MLEIKSISNKLESHNTEESLNRLKNALYKLEYNVNNIKNKSSSSLEEENKALKAELSELKDQFNFVNKSINKIMAEISVYTQELEAIKKIYGNNNNKNK